MEDNETKTPIAYEIENRPVGDKIKNEPTLSTSKKVSMISTFDNPYDPFEDFASWYIYDSSKGYNTCGLLALMCGTSNSFTEEVNDALTEEAIDSIIKNDFLHIYKKITKEVVND